MNQHQLNQRIIKALAHQLTIKAKVCQAGMCSVDFHPAKREGLQVKGNIWKNQ